MLERSLTCGLVRLIASALCLDQKERSWTWRLDPETDGYLLDLLQEDRLFLNASSNDFIATAPGLGYAIPVLFADLRRLSSVNEATQVFSSRLTKELASDHAQISEDVAFVLSVAPLEREPRITSLLLTQLQQHVEWKRRWHLAHLRLTSGSG